MLKIIDKERDLTIADIRKFFEYNSKTGALTNRLSRGKASKGKIAGTITKDGYWQIGIKGALYFGHRLAWAHYYGEWPTEELDHRNNIGTDNRIKNLRDATRAQNRHNSNKIDTVSGLPPGVFKRKNGRFGSKIMVRGKLFQIGTFKDSAAAGAAYMQASVKYHGKYSSFRR